MIPFGLMLMQELNKMSKSLNSSHSEIKIHYNEGEYVIIIPSVSDEIIIPEVKIYDIDGTYWYREIGFNQTITTDNRKCHS